MRAQETPVQHRGPQRTTLSTQKLCAAGVRSWAMGRACWVSRGAGCSGSLLTVRHHARATRCADNPPCLQSRCRSRLPGSCSRHSLRHLGSTGASVCHCSPLHVSLPQRLRKAAAGPGHLRSHESHLGLPRGGRGPSPWIRRVTARIRQVLQC